MRWTWNSRPSSPQPIRNVSHYIQGRMIKKLEICIKIDRQCNFANNNILLIIAKENTISTLNYFHFNLNLL